MLIKIVEDFLGGVSSEEIYFRSVNDRTNEGGNDPVDDELDLSVTAEAELSTYFVEADQRPAIGRKFFDFAPFD